jgi:LPXTG-motif cell wall-anchored protein
MRKGRCVLVVVAGLMLLFYAGGAVAYADDRGNNGTVKIHEGAGESEPVQANDPRVCTFHVHGFSFDKSSSGTWSITGQAPGGTGSASGSWQADTSGEWRTAVLTLAEGHFKLSAKQTSPSTVGGEKQKVLWVSCGASTPGVPGNNANTGSGQTEGNTGGTQGATGNAGGAQGATGGGAEGAAGGPTSGAQGNLNVPGSGAQGNLNTPSGVSPSVSNLPSTSTDSSAPLVALGTILMAFGALLLRRPGAMGR